MTAPIIPQDSRLMRMSRTLHPNTVVRFDAIRFGIEMAWLSYNRLRDVIPDLTVAMCQQCKMDPIVPTPEPVRMYQMFTDAWAFVDNIERLRKLIDSKSLAKRQEIKDFLALTEEIYVVRNFVQHLDEQIHPVQLHNAVVLGSITWAIQHRHHRHLRVDVLAGAVAAGTGRLNMAFELGVVNQRVYRGNPYEYELTLVVSEAEAASESVEESPAPAGPVPAVRIEFPKICDAIPALIRGLEGYLAEKASGDDHMGGDIRLYHSFPARPPHLQAGSTLTIQRTS